MTYFTTSDGTDLGEPTLVNGYANGWLVDPAEVGSDVTIDIDWTPQRMVWIGLALSALGVLACLALILLPLLRRHRGATQEPAEPGEPGDDALPMGASPLHRDGPVLSLASSLIAGVVAGVLGLLFGSLVLGAVLGLLTFVAARVSWGQVVLRATSIGMFAAAAGFIVLKQYRNDYVVDFNWVGRFETAHAWALLAVFALVASVVLDGLRSRAGSAPDPALPFSGSGAPPPPAGPGSSDRSDP